MTDKKITIDIKDLGWVAVCLMVGMCMMGESIGKGLRNQCSAPSAFYEGFKEGLNEINNQPSNKE